MNTSILVIITSLLIGNHNNILSNPGICIRRTMSLILQDFIYMYLLLQDNTA